MNLGIIITKFILNLGIRQYIGLPMVPTLVEPSVFCMSGTYNRGAVALYSLLICL